MTLTATTPPHLLELTLQLYSVRLSMMDTLNREQDSQLLALCLSDAQHLLRVSEGEPVKH